MSTELSYILLVFALFVLPHVLLRARIPSAITSLGSGVVCGMGLHLFHGDQVVHQFAVFGIAALFLFAGLEVDFAQLRRHGRVVVLHLLTRVLTLSATAVAAAWCFGIGPRPACIVALALLTPSAGFILSSLAGFGLDEEERFAVKIKAIASEVLALTVLFVCVQAESWQRLAVSGSALIGVVVVLPIAFWAFVRFVLPRAPKAEFAFLLVLAMLCAFATRSLGAYYLLGAFIVGLVAQRTRAYVPELLSPKVIDAVELFASFFVPFYFFNAGLKLHRDDFGLQALLVGLGFIALVLPLRLAAMVGFRRLAAGKPLGGSLRIATALLPTLVFTLVLAGILRDTFQVPSELFGGLIVYTLVNTLIPGFFLRARPESLDFTSPELSDPDPRAG